MELKDVIKNRRSVRVFKDKGVSRELIEEIIEAGQYAPSACNRQAWKFIVLNNEKIRNQLVDDARASSLLSLSPVVIVILYDKKITEGRHSNIQSASAAIQNMLLTATDLGLASCWVSSIGSIKKVHKILKIPHDYILVAYVCLGYPKIKIDKAPPRKNLQDIVSYDQYNFIDKPVIKSHNPKRWSQEQLKSFRANSVWANSPIEDAHLGVWGETKKEIEIMSNLLNENENVLEILPFAGTIGLNILRNKNLQYNMFELSDSNKRFIEERRKYFDVDKEIRFFIDSKLRTSEKFDCVICSQKLEEINDFNILDDVYNILKQGGRFIVSFRNMLSFNLIHYYLFYTFHLRYKTVKHTGPFKPISYFRMKRILEKKFKIRKIFGISLLPTSLGKKTRLKFLSRIVIFECLKK